MFGALKSRNFRLYFMGQGTSMIGIWMTGTASLWLAYELTSSGWWLGAVGFASQIPCLLITPLAGVFIDRVNRYRLLITLQTLSMITAFLMAGLALFGAMNIYWLLGLTLARGLINSFEIPTRHAFFSNMLGEKKYLSNAIALNSVTQHTSRLIGPTIAGFILARYGAGFCFAVDALSFGTIIGTLLMMRVNPEVLPENKKHPWIDFTEGVKYVAKADILWVCLLLVSLISFFGFSCMVLLPMLARDVFGGDARTLGFLMSAPAVGAVSAGLYLASRKSVIGIWKIITIGTALVSCGFIGLAFSKIFLLSLLFMAFIGMGGSWSLASIATLFQEIISDSKRGRVLSLFFMAFFGIVPLGNLFMGWIAEKWHVSNALMFGGAVCLFACLFFFGKMLILKKPIELSIE